MDLATRGLSIQASRAQMDAARAEGPDRRSHAASKQEHRSQQDPGSSPDSSVSGRFLHISAPRLHHLQTPRQELVSIARPPPWVKLCVCVSSLRYQRPPLPFEAHESRKITHNVSSLRVRGSRHGGVTYLLPGVVGGGG